MKRLGILLTGVAALTSPTTAFAQDAAAPAEAAQTTAPVSSDDIIVTANKRAQNLNDVGLAIDVLGGEALRSRQITSLADVANAVPNLVYTNSSDNTPVYTLRGVSFYDTTVGVYGAVSLNQDEVPLSFAVLAGHLTYDLERIEVLKGPQGTLFGQNSTGGAINFVTAKPTTTFHAGLDVTYGRFNEVDVEGFVSGPISDTLRARVAGRVERADGWQISNSRPNDRSGRIENYMGRLLLDWEPVNGVRIQTDVNAWKDRSDPQAAQYVALQKVSAGVTPGLTAYQFQFSPERPRAAEWKPGFIYRNNRQYQGILRADIDLSDAVTLTSITAYTDYSQHTRQDKDGSLLDISNNNPNDARVRSFYQEARLGNGSAAGFRWTLGANFERSRTSQYVNTFYGDTSTVAFNGFPSNSYSSAQRFTNYAFFGNAELDVSRVFTLKAGARYTNSRDEGTSCLFDETGSPTGGGPFIYNRVLGGRFGTYPAGTCFAINDQGRVVNGVAPLAPGRYADVLHEDNVSWRGGIDYKPRPGLLFYANIAKGYKAGSFPTVSSAFFVSALPIRQESILSYELGIKADLLDRTLQLGLSGYYYDYRDKQLRAKTPQPPFGIQDALVNIPRSSIRGVEATALIRPNSQLTVNVSASYLKATIDEFVGINGIGQAGNFAGTDMPFTPRYQFAVNPVWNFPLRDGVTGSLGANLSYRSDAITVVGGATDLGTEITFAGHPVARIDDYALLDLQAGIDFQEGRYRLALFGKNVLNTYYWTNAYKIADIIARQAGRPATYGITASVRW